MCAPLTAKAPASTAPEPHRRRPEPIPSRRGPEPAPAPANAMNESLRAVRGMNDVLPEEAERWERLEHSLRELLRAYGYRNIRTPLLEHTALFRRAIGEATDIVEK